MEIRLLGVTEASSGERPIAVGAAQQRAVLAMLALAPNTPVSVDSLVDGLWGERAPPTAHKMVQLYVSQLRRLLDGDAEIVTRGRGYELRVPAEAVDAVRFERLLAVAERGDGGAPSIEAALALWRGAPLDDLADMPFAAAEIRRLQELWLRARELAVEHALADGLHREVLGELDELIAADPLRERLHAQRMLALYRSGRQADALAAYRSAHQVLTEEAGIEPGPELRRLHEAILHQDPAIDVVATPGARQARQPPARPRRRSRPPRAVALLAMLVFAAVLAAALAFALDGGPAEAVTVPPNSVAAIDPANNTVIGAIAVGESPGPVTAGAGLLWVLNRSSETLSRIDVRARRLLGTRGIGNTPVNLAASQDEVWIVTGCTVGAPGELVHVFTAGAGGVELLGGDDVAFAGVLPRRRGTYPLAPSGCGLAAEGRSAWIATNVPPGLARVDYDPVAASSRVVWARARERAPIAIAVGSGFVWTADGGHDTIQQFDANTGRVQGTYRTGADPVAVAAAGDTIWVANAGDDTVSRIDLTANLVGKPIRVGRRPSAIAIGAGAVWVANADDGTVTRIDPRTQRPAATITVGHRPEGIAIANGKVWVTVRG